MRTGKDLAATGQFKNKFAERLSYAMMCDGLSTKQAAEKAGIPYSTLLQCVHGSRTKSMNLDTAVKMAQALDVSMDWLCGFTD